MKIKSIVFFCLVLVAQKSVAQESTQEKEMDDKPKFKAADCLLGVEEGPFRCKAYIQVYHWNHEEQKCEIEIYGGCNATSNNFKTFEECMEVASPVCSKKDEPCS